MNKDKIHLFALVITIWLQNVMPGFVCIVTGGGFIYSLNCNSMVKPPHLSTYFQIFCHNVVVPEVAAH